MKQNFFTQEQKEEILRNLRKEYLTRNRAIGKSGKNNHTERQALKQEYLQMNKALSDAFFPRTAHSEMNVRRRQAHQLRRKFYDVLTQWQTQWLQTDQAEVQFGFHDGKLILFAYVPYVKPEIADPRKMERELTEMLRKSVED